MSDEFDDPDRNPTYVLDHLAEMPGRPLTHKELRDYERRQANLDRIMAARDAGVKEGQLIMYYEIIARLKELRYTYVARLIEREFGPDQ